MAATLSGPGSPAKPVEFRVAHPRVCLIGLTPNRLNLPDVFESGIYMSKVKTAPPKSTGGPHESARMLLEIRSPFQEQLPQNGPVAAGFILAITPDG